MQIRVAMQKEVAQSLGDLSATDVATRVRAAKQLSRLGPTAKPAAMALVLACGDEAGEVRQWATAALEAIGPPEVDDVGQLAAFLRGRSADVGQWAATLLGRLRGKAARAGDALARAVDKASNSSVRQRAAWALGEIGPAAEEALPSLHRAVNDSDSHLSPARPTGDQADHRTVKSLTPQKGHRSAPSRPRPICGTGCLDSSVNGLSL